MGDEPPVLDYSRPSPSEPLGNRVGAVIRAVLAVSAGLFSAIMLLGAAMGLMVFDEPVTLVLGVAALIFAIAPWRGTGRRKPRRP